MKLVQGIYLLIGANLGERVQNLARARQLLIETTGKIIGQSGLYETEAWGEADQPDFLNQVLKIEAKLSHEALLQKTQVIEQAMGKIKIGKWRERLIDIDILYYNNRVVRTPILTIPHPEIQNRNFTLGPLCEIAGDEVHPLLRKSHQQLLAESPDLLKVWKYKEQ